MADGWIDETSGDTGGGAMDDETGGETAGKAMGGKPRRRRRFDPGSVVTGLFFLFVAAIYLASGLEGAPVAAADELIPALVVGLGLVGIVRVVTRSRRR